MSRRSTKQRRAARKRRMEIATLRAEYERMIAWGVGFVTIATRASPLLSRHFRWRTS